MVAAQGEELARPLVMAMVDDLVARQASGVLEVAGDPSGAIYLDGGRIAYARASWVPGLTARVRAIAPSLAGPGEPSPGDDAAIALLAVRHGYLTASGLDELIGSVIVEAFLVLTIPLAGNSPVAAVSFTPARLGLTDLFPRLGADVVRGVAVRRAELLAASGLSPATAVAPRDLAAPSTVLTREQWAVACQIGDRASARELAVRRGVSLWDTVHCLSSLVQAGLCVPVQAVPRGQQQAAEQGGAPATGAAPGAAAPSAPAAPSPELLAAGGLPGRVTREHPYSPAHRGSKRPSADVLRRVLVGLRSL